MKIFCTRAITAALPVALAVSALALWSAPVKAAPVGPDAARCAANGVGVLVRVTGLKAATGRLRVQLYYANAKTYLEKRKYVRRVEVPVTNSGTMDVCVAAPASGSYVVSVRHDVNGNGKSDMKDGGGMSGNPKLGVTDLILKKKPKLSAVSFLIGDRTALVTIALRYA